MERPPSSTSSFEQVLRELQAECPSCSFSTSIERSCRTTTSSSARQRGDGDASDASADEEQEAEKAAVGAVLKCQTTKRIFKQATAGRRPELVHAETENTEQEVDDPGMMIMGGVGPGLGLRIGGRLLGAGGGSFPGFILDRPADFEWAAPVDDRATHNSDQLPDGWLPGDLINNNNNNNNSSNHDHDHDNSSGDAHDGNGGASAQEKQPPAPPAGFHPARRRADGQPHPAQQQRRQRSTGRQESSNGYLDSFRRIDAMLSQEFERQRRVLSTMFGSRPARDDADDDKRPPKGGDAGN